jgi:quercetin dioxygenase-like cupin family protein
VSNGLSTKELRAMMNPSGTESGHVIDVRPLGAALAATKTSKLLKTERPEIVRLVLPAGKELAEHTAPGDIVVHCLEGRIAFQAAGQTRELAAGQMLHLARGAPHAVKSLEDSTVLVTILLP